MHHSTEFFILLATAATAGVALSLLAYAWRGRRVDDHPVCRKCRFDLFGLPESSIHCPECGADLSRPRARRIGNRETRRAPRTAGLLLACLTAPVWILTAIVLFRGVDTIRYHPLWMLRNTTRAADVTASDRAYAEIFRRLNAGRLTASDLSPILKETLDLQADANKPWRPVMGDLVEQAWLANSANDELWKRYVRQVMESWIDVRFRSRISRTNGIIGHEIVSLTPRSGSTKRLMPRLDVQIDINWPSKWTGRESFIPGLQFRSSSYGPMASLRSMQLGPHTARAVIKAHVPAAGAPPDRAVDVAFHLDRRWELVDGWPVTPVDDPSMEDAIRRCVRVNFSTRLSRPTPEITVDSPPCPVAWDVRVTAPGWTDRSNLRPPRQVTCDVGETTTARLLLPSDLPTDVQTISLTLAPSAAAAERSIRLNSYWNGTLVFNDLPLPQKPVRTSTGPGTQSHSATITSPRDPPASQPRR